MIPSPPTTPKAPLLARSPSILSESTIPDTATPRPSHIPASPHSPKDLLSFSDTLATPAVKPDVVLSPATYNGPVKPFALAHATKKRAPSVNARKKAWFNAWFKAGELELKRCKDLSFSLVWVEDPFDEEDMWI